MVRNSTSSGRQPVWWMEEMVESKNELVKAKDALLHAERQSKDALLRLERESKDALLRLQRECKEAQLLSQRLAYQLEGARIQILRDRGMLHMRGLHGCV